MLSSYVCLKISTFIGRIYLRMVSKNSYFLLSNNKKMYNLRLDDHHMLFTKSEFSVFFGNNKNNWRPIKIGQGGERESLYHSHLLALLVVQCHTV